MRMWTRWASRENILCVHDVAPVVHAKSCIGLTLGVAHEREQLDEVHHIFEDEERQRRLALLGDAEKHLQKVRRC